MVLGQAISFKVVLQIEGEWYGELDFDLFGGTDEQIETAKQAFLADLASVAATWTEEGRGRLARMADCIHGEAVTA
jgi:hypothetical protein